VIEELLANSHVVSLPMRVRFRGITVREAMLFEGPAGWGEFGAFTEYDDAEAAPWLAAGIEAAYQGPPAVLRTSVDVNATVPAVPAADVPSILARYPGARTAKVKVAEKGQTLADDIARVNAVRESVENVRVDANGGWTVEQAVTALSSMGELQYAEQPCASVEELAEVRRRVSVPIAADESIRKAEDPMRVVRAGAADVAIVKVPPLGGMRAVLRLADELAEFGVPIVVSSALDTAVGMSAGLAAAAALQDGSLACGLATGRLFDEDVAPGREVVNGRLDVTASVPDPARLQRLAASAERRDWWHARARRAYALVG
jgi:O-succinylbenzoate synthase